LLIGSIGFLEILEQTGEAGRIGLSFFDGSFDQNL
jgi:hypothetical protein